MRDPLLVGALVPVSIGALTFVMVQFDLVQKPWPADSTAPSVTEPLKHSHSTVEQNANGHLPVDTQ